MTRLTRCLLPALLIVLLVNVAVGIERFPPPDFTNHTLPETQFAQPRSPNMQYVDVGLLVVALALASYFALARRSRRGLFLLSIASLIWFGFVRDGCVCSIGAIQNVTQAVFDTSLAIPVVVILFFVLPLIFTLLFGRTFCASVCPLGAVQELVALHPIAVPRWLNHGLGLLRHVYLGLAVALAATGTAFIICRYDPFVGFFRLGAGLPMLIAGGCLLLIGVFVGRPYCRYLCPYGVILGWLSRVSMWHARITPNECVHCRLCEEVCPYGAIEEPAERLTSSEVREVRPWLVAFIVLLPVLVVAGGLLGCHLAVPLSRLDPAVELAERIHAEENHLVKEMTDASEAYRNTQRPIDDLYKAANAQRYKLGLAGLGFGAWVGLVLGLKLISLARYPKRTDYDPNPSECVSCGRCFWYCPQQHGLQAISHEER